MKQHTSIIVYDLRVGRLKTLIDSEHETGIYKLVWDEGDESGDLRLSQRVRIQYIHTQKEVKTF